MDIPIWVIFFSSLLMSFHLTQTVLHNIHGFVVYNLNWKGLHIHWLICLLTNSSWAYNKNTNSGEKNELKREGGGRTEIIENCAEWRWNWYTHRYKQYTEENRYYIYQFESRRNNTIWRRWENEVRCQEKGHGINKIKESKRKRISKCFFFSNYQFRMENI